MKKPRSKRSKTVSEISKQVKRAIALQIRLGKLPKMGLSVRLRTSATSASINIKLKPSFHVLNPDHLSGQEGATILNKRAQTVLDKVKKIAEANSEPGIRIFIDYDNESKKTEREIFKLRRRVEELQLKIDRAAMRGRIARIAEMLPDAGPKTKKNPKESKPSKITKTSMKPIVSTYNDLIKVIKSKFPDVSGIKLMADASVHDCPRHFAMASVERSGPTIRVAPELASRPVGEIRGVIMHELGHILVLLGVFPMKRGHDASERQADAVAEEVFGNKIYYKKNGVQCSGPGSRGVRPRPKGLR